jgi:copper(I)-binding protein
MMRTLIVSLALFAAACGAPPEPAAPPAEPAGPAINVTDAWATVTPGGVNVSAGYLAIANSGAEADRLTGASTPRAASVEMHTMTMNAGVMEMRQVDGLDVPAGGAASLAPGGNHLMFIGVTQPFTEGEQIPVTLTFEHGGTVELSLPVRPASGAGPAGH